MVGVGWAWRSDRAEGREADQRAAGAEAVAAQVNQTRATEHAQAETLATIGAKYEEDRTAAATVPAAVVADLRAGRLQLRDDLATCSTSLLSQAVAGAVERDARRTTSRGCGSCCSNRPRRRRPRPRQPSRDPGGQGPTVSNILQLIRTTRWPWTSTSLPRASGSSLTASRPGSSGTWRRWPWWWIAQAA